jgi:hypothetical protein
MEQARVTPRVRPGNIWTFDGESAKIQKSL